MEEPNELEHYIQATKLEALGRFAGGIAHDFNNILSIIEGYTYIALKQLREGTLTSEQLSRILSSTQRGAGLTRQLLAFSRQKVDIDEKVNVARALDGQVMLMNPLMGEMIELELTISDEAQCVDISEDRLAQIVMNLCLNARDALGNGGRIEVSFAKADEDSLPEILRILHRDNGYGVICVKDNGEGIEPDVLPQIFNPFFSTKAAHRGTGLGLSVVYGIVEQARGKVMVSSEIGRGTEFKVYLPLSDLPCRIEKDEVVDDPLSLKGRTILIAEDEPELREVLNIMLGDMGLKVLSACNGNHALRVQEDYEGSIDFLLTDVVMPEMDGVHLGELFASVRPDSNVVYMSGYPFMDGRKDMRVPESAAFISKPLQEDKIRQILERALVRKRERCGGNGNGQGA